MQKKSKHVLHVDIDRDIVAWGWKQDYIKSVKAVLQAFGYKPTRFIFKKSPSNTGWHVWIHITGKPLTDEQLNKLQWLAGHDDLTRVYINQLRIKRGLKKYWNKLFARHIWVKPIPETCKKCRLRKYLNEIREAEQI